MFKKTSFVITFVCILLVNLISSFVAQDDNINKKNIKIFYGDSDGDIRDAQANDIRAIRIIRARDSTIKSLPKNGNLGEEVLVN